MSTDPAVALALRGVRKAFGTLVALDDVAFEARAGELHALVGENGAGKSTLARIAAGALRPDAGSIDACGAVGLVHQRFRLAERLRVWENVVLGCEPRRGWRLDRTAARARVVALGARYGLEVPPDARVETLPVALRQRVELLRALAREPAILILDEPTAALTAAESDALFAALAQLTAAGVAVVVVTHKLADVLRHAARVTVLRAGSVVLRAPAARTTLDELVAAMVGGPIPALAPRAPTAPRRALEIRALSTPRAPFPVAGVTLEVRGGEIVGIAGVEGNGQTALYEALAGTIPYAGSVVLDGRPLHAGAGPRARLHAGIRTIPQDRITEGLVPAWSVADNLALGAQRTRFARGALYDRATARRAAEDAIDAFDIRPPAAGAAVATLSGGNQQKVVVARALAGAPRVVLAYGPAHGIDVGAAALVHSRLLAARNAGCAILLISFDLDEIFALADRIAVLANGRLGPCLPREACDRATLGTLMAGTG